MADKLKVKVNSEIGELEAVILHTPGQEIENMTPENAERALYSDILNLSVVNNEYRQLEEVLKKVSKTYQVKQLLKDILKNDKVKKILVRNICNNENIDIEIAKELLQENSEKLAKILIEGLAVKVKNLSTYLNKEKFELRPLHNFFFTRDASVSVFNDVLISKMASNVRAREAIIMEAIFDYHPEFETKTFTPIPNKQNNNVKIEGGDLLIAADNVLLIGMGERTSSQGIDFVIEEMKKRNKKVHLIIQELPETPESFIHLDMIFTFIDKDACLVYEPVVMNANRYQTIHITVEGNKVRINEEKNLIKALDKVGISLKPVFCGGVNRYIQDREQWHSGANLFAIGPGKVMGYSRNVYTVEELAKNNFDVIRAIDIISGKEDITKRKKYIITIDGSELPRGGGGCRCMTMPVRRKNVNF